MFEEKSFSYSDKPKFYSALKNEMTAYADPLSSIATLANASALLMQHLPEINWAGFYLINQGELVLGPFQGKPACLRIRLGRGVCGTSAERRQTLVVANVDEFPGHIACDSASRSEVVVPLVLSEGSETRLLGVLDIDSPNLNRFDEADAQGLEEFVRVLLTSTIWT